MVRRLRVVLGVLLAGCGARTGLETFVVDGGTGACPPALPTPAAPVRPVGAACDFPPDGGTRDVVLALLADERLLGIDGRGLARELYRFAQAPAFARHSLGGFRVLSRGGYLAAALVQAEEPRAAPWRAAVEVALLRTDGTLLLHDQSLVEGRSGQPPQVALAGHASGVFAVGVETPDTHRVEVLRVDGVRSGLESGVSLAAGAIDPDARGSLVVHAEVDPARGSADLFWLDACTHVRTATRYRQETPRGMFYGYGSSLAYADLVHPALVVEDAASVRRFEVTASGVEVYELVPAGWALLGTGARSQVAAVRLPDGLQRTVPLTLPAGQRPFVRDATFGPVSVSSTHGGFGIDSEGRVLLGLRDDAGGRLYATADGTIWQPVGEAVGRVRTLHAMERQGTFVIRSEPLGLLPDDWGPAPAGVTRVDLPAVQLVRPAAGIALVVARGESTRPYHLSADGGCLAYLAGTRQLMAVSATTGRTYPLPLVLPADGAWSPALTWVPGDDAVGPRGP